MTQDKKKRSPIFSSRPIAATGDQPQSEVAAVGSSDSEASAEISAGEQALLEKGLTNRMYMTEYIQPIELDPYELEQAEHARQIILATATHRKLEAQMRGASQEEQEQAYHLGIQEGSQVWGQQQYDRMLQLYDRYGTHRRSDLERRAQIFSGMRNLSETISRSDPYGNDDGIVFRPD